MKRVPLPRAVLAAGMAVAFGACAPGPHPQTPDQVRVGAARRAVVARVDSILNTPALEQTHVGVAVWSLDRREWILDRDADKLFVPASNAKLYIAAAALHALGPSTVFRTRLYADSLPVDTLISGNLYLVGGGNPDLSTGDLVRFAERLRALGVRRVTGSLVLDSSPFDSIAFGSGWMWDDGPYPYDAPISGFLLNENVVALTVRPGPAAGDTVRVAVSPQGAGIPLLVTATTHADSVAGPAISATRAPGSPVLAITGSLPVGALPETLLRTVPDPAAYAGSVLRSALARDSIVIRGATVSGSAPDSSLVPLAYASSEPVDVLVRRFLKESDNLVGETLVKQIGVAMRGEGSWRAGLAGVRAALADFDDLDSTSYRLADGSGLSRYTECSPRETASLVARMASEFSVGPEYLSALPVAGQDGTLRNRLDSPNMVGTVRGKTGTMSGVSALSGLLVTDSGERLAFSIMMNGFVGSVAPMRAAQDAIVEVLRTWPAPRTDRP